MARAGSAAIEARVPEPSTGPFPYRRVARVQAIAAIVWGLILLVFPGFVIWLLGADTDPTGLLVGRFAGGMMFALGVTITVTWTTTDDAIRQRVAFGNAACDLALALALLQGATAGTTSGFVGWMVVFFFSFNAVSWVGTRWDRTGLQPAA